MGSAGKVNIDENFWNLVFMIYWSNCITKKKFSKIGKRRGACNTLVNILTR